MLGRLLNLGIYPDLSFQYKNKLRVFNTACTLVLLICSFYFVFGLVRHYYLATLVSVFFITSIIVSLRLTCLRKYNLAFHVAMICGFIFVTAFTLLFGADSKSYYYFLFMPVAGTILFDSIKTTIKYMVLSIVFLLFNVAFTEYMSAYYNIEGLWFFGYPNMVFTALLIFMGLRVFKLENQKYAKQIEEQRHSLQEKNTEMTDSIIYAKRIQYALLAHANLLSANLPEHFILFKPKDIVSGDFYWAAKKDHLFYLAVCDSTGHGVPGAFMSLLNLSFLNEALNEKQISEPDKILNYVRDRLIETISQEGVWDGMDATVMCYDERVNSLSYAAANNAPVLIRGKQIIKQYKDKMPVGKGENTDSFVLQTIVLQPGDCFYMLTDGYADQFGGAAGKKYKLKQLESLLLAHHLKPMAKQQKAIEDNFYTWSQDLEQVDDICITGIRF